MSFNLWANFAHGGGKAIPLDDWKDARSENCEWKRKKKWKSSQLLKWSRTALNPTDLLRRFSSYERLAVPVNK